MLYIILKNKKIKILDKTVVRILLDFSLQLNGVPWRTSGIITTIFDANK